MYIQCIKLTNSSNRSPGDPGDEIRFNRHLEVSANFKLFAVSATMSQRKIHLTRMNSQNPLDIFSHNSMLYSGSSGTCPRKFYDIATLASIAWPSGTNSRKTIDENNMLVEVVHNKLSF